MWKDGCSVLSCGWRAVEVRGARRRPPRCPLLLCPFEARFHSLSPCPCRPETSAAMSVAAVSVRAPISLSLPAETSAAMSVAAVSVRPPIALSLLLFSLLSPCPCQRLRPSFPSLLPLSLPLPETAPFLPFLLAPSLPLLSPFSCPLQMPFFALPFSSRSSPCRPSFPCLSFLLPLLSPFSCPLQMPFFALPFSLPPLYSDR